MRSWTQWHMRPGKSKRPTRMETDQYFCEHGLVDFDLNNKHDRKEKRFAVLEADDYEQFSSWYTAGRKISFTFADHESQPGGPTFVAHMNPEPCADCRRARKKDFADGFIRAHVIPAKDDPRLPENKEKAVVPSNKRSESPPARGHGITQPTRQSARTRQATGAATKPRIIRINIGPKMTVKDFKSVPSSSLSSDPSTDLD